MTSKEYIKLKNKLKLSIPINGNVVIYEEKKNLYPNCRYCNIEILELNNTFIIIRAIKTPPINHTVDWNKKTKINILIKHIRSIKTDWLKCV